MNESHDPAATDLDTMLLYVLRVWRGSAFRASVRAVDSERSHLFSSAADVVRYLEQAAAPQPRSATDGAAAYAAAPTTRRRPE